MNISRKDIVFSKWHVMFLTEESESCGFFFSEHQGNFPNTSSVNFYARLFSILNILLIVSKFHAKLCKFYFK